MLIAMLKISLKFLWILNHELQIMNYESGIKNVKRMVVFSRKYFFFLTFNQKQDDPHSEYRFLLFSFSVFIHWSFESESFFNCSWNNIFTERCLFVSFFG